MSIELQTITVLAGLRVCPVCFGTGNVWLSEHESNWLGTSVRCWECNGKGHRYERTETR